MTRRVDKIKNIFPAVVRLIFQPHGARLYGNAPLALDIHIIEELFLHIALGNGLRLFEYSVRERGLAVVDMRYYAEIPYIAQIRLIQIPSPP